MSGKVAFTMLIVVVDILCSNGLPHLDISACLFAFRVILVLRGFLCLLRLSM